MKVVYYHVTADALVQLHRTLAREGTPTASNRGRRRRAARYLKKAKAQGPSVTDASRIGP